VLVGLSFAKKDMALLLWNFQKTSDIPFFSWAFA